jgi:hypothetical protein
MRSGDGMVFAPSTPDQEKKKRCRLPACLPGLEAGNGPRTNPREHHMAVATIGINPAVFIESYQPDPSPKWIGKVANSESNETYSLDRAAFELSEGVIALRLAAGVSRFAKDLVFELHVGHALTQVLQVGDREEIVAGPYYAKCLHLGSGGIPGQSPRVGRAKSTRFVKLLSSMAIRTPVFNWRIKNLNYTTLGTMRDP